MPFRVIASYQSQVCPGRVIRHLANTLLVTSLFASASAQEAKPVPSSEPKGAAPKQQELSPAPAKVDVQPVARDAQIQQRLQAVLKATGWFTGPEVRVEEGVVFLSGVAETDDLKSWAGDLARNTQDVVAVANRMRVSQPAAFDFSSAWNGLGKLWRDIIGSLPFVLFGLLVLGLSAGAGVLSSRMTRKLLARRVRAGLLRSVIAWFAGCFVFLAGTYVVLRVSGLTQLAMTVVGGTGLVGLALGIAFRDISENFLASVFLSLQRPFETGDLIEVDGFTGLVQQLNIRTTMLMTLDGNIVQIPNATVYKKALRNFTANANRREVFVVGIGYDDPIDKAQEIIRRVLDEHPAVLKDPEPWVLVDNLGASTINLKVYFWLNGKIHSNLKVRSSAIRLTKSALQQGGISMPDEAREVIFPHGIPVTMVHASEDSPAASRLRRESSVIDDDASSTPAEGGLTSEVGTLEEQARQAKPLDTGENLLKPVPASPPPLTPNKP